jgi:triosephosphate isomerase
MLQQEEIGLSAQNCSTEPQGAFTGELSAPMLRSVGATYTLIGHSERRQGFGETSQIVSKKINAALSGGLKAIVCCGEPLEVREKQEHISYVTNQLTASLQGVAASDLSSVILAYEPVWAIGTGHTAKAEQVQEMHKALRTHIASLYSKDAGQELTILYGGSCNATNAPTLFSLPDVDGGLIGGASLQSRSFIDIAKSFTW